MPAMLRIIVWIIVCIIIGKLHHLMDYVTHSDRQNPRDWFAITAVLCIVTQGFYPGRFGIMLAILAAIVIMFILNVIEKK